MQLLKNGICFQDLSGKKRKTTAKDLLAHIIQHEMDHLNGLLFVDKAVEVYSVEATETKKSTADQTV